MMNDTGLKMVIEVCTFGIQPHLQNATELVRTDMTLICKKKFK